MILNKSQQQRALSWIGACRTVYNLGLEIKINAYKNHKISVPRFDLQKQLLDLKKDFDWIRDVQSQVLQEALLRLDKTYQNFFRGNGFPKFAKKDRYNSITFPQSVTLIAENKISLPKFGEVKIFKDRLPGSSKIRQATIIKEVDGFYITLVVEENPNIPQKSSESQAVGIDMGVVNFATLSDGTIIQNPHFLAQYAKQLRIEQRSLARKKKGSNSFKKQKRRLSKLYHKITRKRQDFLHKQSSMIINKYDSIVVENLKLKNMTKSAKGTIEEPGKMVKQKSGLNRVILDVSIGEFFRQLDYKAEWRGKTITKVDAKHTSQKCSNCGHVEKSNRKTQSRFECVKCGHCENADQNASKNILARTMAKVA